MLFTEVHVHVHVTHLEVYRMYNNIFFFLGTCLEKIYVMAFTSDRRNSDTGHSHKIEVVSASQNKSIRLLEHEGDAYTSEKGDLWKLSFVEDLGFLPYSCIRYIHIIISIYLKATINCGY